MVKFMQVFWNSFVFLLVITYNASQLSYMFHQVYLFYHLNIHVAKKDFPHDTHFRFQECVLRNILKHLHYTRIRYIDYQYCCFPSWSFFCFGNDTILPIQMNIVGAFVRPRQMHQISQCRKVHVSWWVWLNLHWTRSSFPHIGSVWSIHAICFKRVNSLLYLVSAL